MKKLFLLLIFVLAFVSCGDDETKKEDPKVCSPVCESWQTCNTTSGICELTAGKCTENTNCTTEGQICDLTTHECKTLTCNENLTPSDLSVTDSCTEIESVDCMVSSECGDGKRCENVGGEFEVACCVPGLRGCKEAGEPCTSELECAEGLCLNRNDGAFYCSKICETNADCPEPISECADMYFFNACAVPNAGK